MAAVSASIHCPIERPSMQDFRRLENTASNGPAAATVGPPARGAPLIALGVVFGNLGTSPLYTLLTVVEAVGRRLTPATAIGILSLIAAPSRPTRTADGQTDREGARR